MDSFTVRFYVCLVMQLHSNQFFATAKSHKSFPFETQCHVTTCELKMTPEHAAQVAMVQHMGVTEADCVNRVAMINSLDYSGVFCPQDKFCGLDLEPNFTNEMRLLANKSCSVFVKYEEYCQDLTRLLRSSG